MTDSPFRTPDYGDRLHRLEAAVANLEKTVGKLNKTPARPRRSLMEWIEEHVPVLLIVVLEPEVVAAPRVPEVVDLVPVRPQRLDDGRLPHVSPGRR